MIRKPRRGAAVRKYIPDNHIPLVYEALDIVGKARFKRHWRKAKKAYADYEKTTKRGTPNPEAARDQTEWEFRLHSEAIELLRDFLCGRIPDGRGAVRAFFLPENSRRKAIPIDPWHFRSDSALALFRTPQHYYDEESDKLWPKSPQNYARLRELLEGCIIVSKRDLMHRVALAFRAAADGRPAGVATESVVQEAIVELTEWLRQEKDLTITRENWWARLRAKFKVGNGTIERRIWPIATSYPDTAHWRNPGRKRKSPH
jgi:hypothetical protein